MAFRTFSRYRHAPSPGRRRTMKGTSARPGRASNSPNKFAKRDKGLAVASGSGTLDGSCSTPAESREEHRPTPIRVDSTFGEFPIRRTEMGPVQ